MLHLGKDTNDFKHIFFFLKLFFFLNFRRIFYKELGQGENECCPYSNTDCVNGGQRETNVKLHVRKLNLNSYLKY